MTEEASASRTPRCRQDATEQQEGEAVQASGDGAGEAPSDQPEPPADDADSSPDPGEGVAAPAGDDAA